MKDASVNNSIQTKRNFIHPIDPTAFTHLCDSSGSYMPKSKKEKPTGWQKVSDKTGRGFE